MKYMTARMNALLVVGLIILAILSRWLPHPPNFSPVMGIALFAGARLSSKTWAFFLPVITMAISDLWLGWHSTLPFVYLSLILMTLIGWGNLKSKSFSWPRLGLYSTVASVLFFVITNFGVWLTQDLYSKDGLGLMACFAAALPFYPATLISGVIYSFALFGLNSSIEKFSLLARQNN
jgi:hypothetical protein